ncbi:MAG TPA: hypothetical protein IAC50_08235 [Candidatus Copromorpha excrementigallinarum]|uniref:Uncharacterized protein n=1 Tax=Candidatus Allocopromorpha excrementigallinarum TaxID=2840742 RepID=A0A9D1I3E1_9FIRM|nr:hypothetical protein [Candidatus Copromorpha excrementigallinarum]
MENTLQAGVAFNKKMVRLGMITVAFAIVANFVPAIYLWIAYGVWPGVNGVLQVWGIAAAAYGISWVVQPIAYFGVLGASGSYIGWLAGSVGDIRLPSAAMAQKVAKVEQGTHEGDVMATIGTSSSVLVSVGFVTLFTIIGSRVLPYFPQAVLDAFNYILPALFAAVYVEVAKKDIRTGLTGIVVGLLIMYLGTLIGISSAVLTLIIVFSGVVVNRVFYVIDRKKGEE